MAAGSSRQRAPSNPQANAKRRRTGSTNELPDTTTDENDLPSQIKTLESRLQDSACLPYAKKILRKLPKDPALDVVIDKRMLRKIEEHILAVHGRHKRAPGKHRIIEGSRWKLPLAVAWALFGDVYLQSIVFCDTLIAAEQLGIQLSVLYSTMCNIRDQNLQGKRVAVDEKNGSRPEWKPLDVVRAQQFLNMTSTAVGVVPSTGSYILPDGTSNLSKDAERSMCTGGYKSASDITTNNADWDNLPPGSPTKHLLDSIRSVDRPEVALALEKSTMILLEGCTSETKDLWDAVGGVPRLLTSSLMFSGGNPIDTRSLWSHCTRSSKFKLWRNSAGVVDIGATQRLDLLEQLKFDFWQSDPVERRISALFTLPSGCEIVIPPLPSDPIARIFDPTEAILTCAGGVTDVHIDNGASVMSVPVGDSRRLFFLWPPTEENRNKMRKIETRGERLVSCCRELRGGLFTVLDSTNLLRMRPGTLHAVLTLTGGFILSRGYYDDETLPPLSRYISDLSREEMSQQELKDYADRWIHIAAITRMDTIIECWATAADYLVYPGHLPTVQKSLREFWSEAASLHPEIVDIPRIVESLNRLPSRKTKKL